MLSAHWCWMKLTVCWIWVLLTILLKSSPVPEERQTLLFSATWPDEIAAVSRRFQRDPQTIEINSTDELRRLSSSFMKFHGVAKLNCYRNY